MLDIELNKGGSGFDCHIRATLAFAAEAEAAAIEECERVCLAIAKRYDGEVQFKTLISGGAYKCADAIAKLREGK
jgi:hypothetical protein